MKKALFAICMLAAMALNAQDYKKFRLGLSVAPNIGWIKSNDKEFVTDGARVGIGGGLVTDFYFSKNYGITTGLQIMNVGGQVQRKETGVLITQTFKNQYVQLPFALKMKTNDFSGFNIYGVFGISAEYCFRGLYNEDVNAFGIVRSSTNNDAKADDRTRNLRLGLNVGLGTEYNIAGSTSLFFGLMYNNGIVGSQKKYTESGTVFSPSGNLNYFAINLGVLF